MFVGVCIVGASFVYLMVVPEGDGGGMANMGSNLTFIGHLVGGGLLFVVIRVLWIIYTFFWTSSSPASSTQQDEESGDQ
jgi:hypothetical protein